MDESKKTIALTSTDGQSQQQEYLNKQKGDNDLTPNTKKKRTPLEDRCKKLKDELKESKSANLKIGKGLRNQLKEKQAEVIQLRKENVNLTKKLAALFKEHPAKKELEKLRKKYEYLLDEHKKLRQTKF